jgi:hypothetical protein
LQLLTSAAPQILNLNIYIPWFWILNFLPRDHASSFHPFLFMRPAMCKLRWRKKIKKPIKLKKLKKKIEKIKLWKKPIKLIKILKNQTGPNPNKKTKKNQSQTGKKPESNWKNRPKPVWTDFYPKNRTETGRFEPVSVRFLFFI